jgi:starch synthase
LRYGAAPLVSRVGGLADTVIDANDAAVSAGVATGVQFGPATVDALTAAIKRAVALFHKSSTMRRMQHNAMHADVSWRGPAQQYGALYRLIAGPARSGEF